MNYYLGLTTFLRNRAPHNWHTVSEYVDMMANDKPETAAPAREQMHDALKRMVAENVYEVNRLDFPIRYRRIEKN